MDILRFSATLWGLRDNVRCPSWAHWKARSAIPITVADFLQTPFCVFEPPLENLGAMYGDHLRLVVNRVWDFLLVLIDSLSRTAEALQAIIGSKSAISLQRGPVTQNFR